MNTSTERSKALDERPRRSVTNWLMKMRTTFYRRMILVERFLSPPPSRPKLAVATQIGLLSPPEVASERSGFREALDPSSISDRVARGHSCFAVWVEGRIVHTAWVAVERATVEYLGRDLLLEPDEIYIFDSYTLPGYRGMKIAQARGAYVARHYAQRGFRRSLGLVAVENAAGLAVPEALGYRRIGVYSNLGLGRWCRAWSRPSPGERIPRLVSMR